MPATKDKLDYPEVYAKRALEALNRAFPDWSQTDIGEELGVDQSTVQRWQKGGKYKVPLRALLIVSERLGIGLDEILALPWLPPVDERLRVMVRQWLRIDEQSPASSDRAPAPSIPAIIATTRKPRALRDMHQRMEETKPPEAKLPKESPATPSVLRSGPSAGKPGGRAR